MDEEQSRPDGTELESEYANPNIVEPHDRGALPAAGHRARL